MRRRAPLLLAVLVFGVAAQPVRAAPAEILQAVWDGEPPAGAGLAGQMRADLAVLTHLPDRVAGTFGEHWAAVYLGHRLPGRRLQRETVLLAAGGTTQNLWATFGSGPRQLMLGAHYDTVVGSPGADDNASGVTVLLALIPMLESGVPAGLAVTLAFFGAEEFQRDGNGDPIIHHQGSRSRAGSLFDDGRLPDVMISVDMVGVGDEVLAVTLGAASNEAARLLTRAGTRAGIRVRRAARGDISDHGAFAAAGVAAAMLWRPDNPAYHLPGDDAVSIDNLLQDVRLLSAAVVLAGDRGVAIPASALGRFRQLRK